MTDKPNLPIASQSSQQLVKKVGRSLKITAQLLAKMRPNADDWAWWNGLSDEWKFLFLENLKWEKSKYYEEWDDGTGYLYFGFYFDWEQDLPSDLAIQAADLKTLLNIHQFSACYANISDISALSGLTQLRELDLRCNKISDLSALSCLTQLRELDLFDNKISDLSALSCLTQLQKLYLRGNEISDISALSCLTQLQKLDLSGNEISDISALSGLMRLEKLYLRGNQISKSQIAWLQQQLPNTEIYHDYEIRF